MRRAFIILVILLIVLLLVGIGIYFSGRGSDTAAIPEGIGDPPGTLPAPPSSEPEIPTGERFSIQGPRGAVSVKNFYPTALALADQSVLIEDTDMYSIAYVRTSGLFVLTLRGESRDEVLGSRAAAENAFLTILDIDQASACRLRAEENISGAGELEFVQNKGLALSFCSTPATQ